MPQPTDPEHPQPTDPAPVVATTDVAAPADRVWRELTKQQELQRAMFDSHLEFDPEPGGELRYRSPDGAHTFIIGRVARVDEPRAFEHTFAFSNLDDPPSAVLWDIEPTGPESCRVTVTHGGFHEETRTLKAVRSAWPDILERFRRVCEGRGLALGDRMKYFVMRLSRPLLPKSLRTENVERRAPGILDAAPATDSPRH